MLAVTFNLFVCASSASTVATSSDACIAGSDHRSPQQIGEFRSWFTESGGELSADFMQPGGLQATSAISDEAQILSVPPSLIITVSKAKLYVDEYLSSNKTRTCSLHLQAYLNNTTVAFHAHQMIAAFLLLHRYRTQTEDRDTRKSTWQPYVDTLPQHHYVPSLYDAKHLSMLKGSPVLPGS
jgi:hypothetical protein